MEIRVLGPILALYRSGRQADALATFRVVRQCLQEALGVECGAELPFLHRRILNADPTLAGDVDSPLLAHVGGPWRR
jgi:DNA-binding SARP family transcriptional activator